MANGKSNVNMFGSDFYITRWNICSPDIQQFSFLQTMYIYIEEGKLTSPPEKFWLVRTVFNIYNH